mmetsp:Transcript_16853/g.21876  ORF Transcript_16853/g.21876 Transcript_16853/m.21876 type:complete len:163 (+) Transcript_16853:2-490(+)
MNPARQPKSRSSSQKPAVAPPQPQVLKPTGQPYQPNVVATFEGLQGGQQQQQLQQQQRIPATDVVPPSNQILEPTIPQEVPTKQIAVIPPASEGPSSQPKALNRDFTKEATTKSMASEQEEDAGRDDFAPITETKSNNGHFLASSVTEAREEQTKGISTTMI